MLKMAWVEKKKMAGGYKFKVMIKNDQGKKEVKRTYDLNQKRAAYSFAESLRQMEPHLAAPEKITFDTAFSAYKKDVLEDELKTQEFRLVICGMINNHIAPHISKSLMTDYTLYDFEKSFIPALINSKGMVVKNIALGKTEVIRGTKKLGKKSIKDAVANFKMFIRYCHGRKWVIDPAILNWKFNKNFFQDENTKAKWQPKYKQVLKIVDSEQDPLNQVLFYTAAETGARLSELLALTHSDIDLKSRPALIYTNHSLDKWDNLRENFLKTATSKRGIEISKGLAIMLKNWMECSIAKKQGKYKMLFGITKASAKKRIQRAAKRCGIAWQNGMSPFRKFSYSYLKDTQQFTDKQLMLRFGWSNMDTPNKWYYKDIDKNQPERIAAIEGMLLN
mgnify:CR=1 FL=1|tara:strand:+ start:255 stop:1427 length:1173 start_codon:yes stop_codon:yes gene_type:complete